MHEAVDVAIKLLKIADDQDKKLSNLQLQKLVYIAHGFTLAFLKEKLIEEKISAWQYGPVIPEIYHQFKEYGASKIPLWGLESTTTGDYSPDVKKILEGVVKSYGKLQGGELIHRTHLPGTPWYKVWNEEGGQFFSFTEIPNKLIRKHFLKVVQSKGKMEAL